MERLEAGMSERRLRETFCRSAWLSIDRAPVLVPDVIFLGIHDSKDDDIVSLNHDVAWGDNHTLAEIDGP
jgi:hypothetical protein